jgi:hypothetical protein
MVGEGRREDWQGYARSMLKFMKPEFAKLHRRIDELGRRD